MSEAPATAGASGVPASQLLLVRDQLRRSPFVVAVIDICLAWLLVRAGFTPWVFAWVVLSGALQVGRALHVQRIVGRAGDPTAAVLRQVYTWFFALGVVRAVPVVAAFTIPDNELQFLVTLITVGSAAGGVGSAAGLVKAYAAWAVPLGGVQIAAWLSHQDFEGRWIAGLLALMFGLLVLNVRSYGQTLHQLGEEVARVNAERLRAEAERLRAETERRRADDERRRAEVAVEAKARFFAAASHDLRQPLGVLRWYGDAVRLHADQLNHAPLRDIGDGIGRALAHAEPLVRKYLDIARIEAGAIELTPRRLQVVPLFQQVVDAYDHDAQSAGLTLGLHLDAPPAQLAVLTDEGVLRSILDNLVGNALKFTPARGRVTLVAQRVDGPAGPLVRLAVVDTGVGIAPADQARVFEDFFQVDNQERNRSKGMGLGLAIVQRQAQLIGSAIRLQSAPGQGSRFELDLPAVAATEAPAAPEPAPSWPDTDGQAVRVLVIDDEPEIRKALRMMLEAVNWQVATAAGLAEAQQALAGGFAADAILADYRLRDEQTGADVIKALRAEGCQAPAVVLTGDTSPEQLRLLAGIGLPVLHKPVAGEQLVATVIDLLGPEGVRR